MNNLKTEIPDQDGQKYKIKRNWEKKALTDTETDN